MLIEITLKVIFYSLGDKNTCNAILGNWKIQKDIKKKSKLPILPPLLIITDTQIHQHGDCVCVYLKSWDYTV